MPDHTRLEALTYQILIELGLQGVLLDGHVELHLSQGKYQRPITRIIHNPDTNRRKTTLAVPPALEQRKRHPVPPLIVTDTEKVA
jgi:hypothetical protein